MHCFRSVASSLLLLSLFPAAAVPQGVAVGEVTSAELRSLLDADGHMMRKHLRTRVHEALDRRLEKLEELHTEEQIDAYRDRLRDFFRETVDLDSFAKTPLRAEVTGRLERDGYAIEKVIFESQPGFHVTANLYLPAGRGPFPGILHPCGHSSNGKAAEAYQKANLLLVRHGFAVLCFDPIGQGERKQLLDPGTGKGLLSPTGEHHVLGVAPVLLGRGLSSYMIWDGIRAIDYLQSRHEVDPERIGCTGNSGGGNLTAFLMALDDRIGAAAPGCFLTTTRRKNEKPGPGDPEQNLFGQIREGLDHPDLAILRAPRPTLILAATKDFVPIEGTWEAFRQAKRMYSRLGYPERIDLVEAPEPHGFSQRLREGAVRFFARHLQDRRIEVFEDEVVPVEPEADLLCTPSGQVLGLPRARTVFDLNRERAKALGEVRRETVAGQTPEELRESVRKTLGLEEKFGSPRRMVGPIFPVAGKSGAKQAREEYFVREGGIVLPGLLIGAEKDGQSPLRLILTDREWDASGKVTPEWSAEQAGGEGARLLVNLSDSGLTRTKNWRFYGADQWIAQMLGTSYLAMRTEDLLSVARALRESGRTVHLQAEKEFVPVALHAAALHPDWFASVTLVDGWKSWSEVIESREPLPHLPNVVHGALRHYDLSDLIPLIPREKLQLR